MTNAEWLETARRAIRELAATGRTFTADDLYDAVTHPDLNHQPNARNNLIGQAFRELAHAGEIRAVGVVRSKQPNRKSGMIRVWQGRNWL